MDGPRSLGVERGDERVLEHAVARRLAQVVVHLAGRREDALDAGRRGRRGEELFHHLGFAAWSRLHFVCRRGAQAGARDPAEILLTTLYNRLRFFSST